MRTLFLILFLATIPSSNVSAQLRWAFRAGPDITRLDIELQGTKQANVDAVIGLHIGFNVNLGNGPFSVRTGLFFSNARALFNGTDLLKRSEFHVSYLLVPVDLKLTANRDGIVRPYTFIGTDLKYSLNLEDKQLVLQDDLKLVSTAASIGAGISVRFKGVPFRFSPEVRYSSDLFGLYSGEVELNDGGIARTAKTIKANTLRVGFLLGM